MISSQCNWDLEVYYLTKCLSLDPDGFRNLVLTINNYTKVIIQDMQNKQLKLKRKEILNLIEAA